MLKKMIAKKLLMTGALFIAVSSVASAAFAAAAAPAPYVGGGLGLTVNSSHGSSYRGVPLTIFGGYGGVVSNGFYMAGEVFADVVTADLNNSSSQLSSSYAYGISFIPGVMLSQDTLGFVRLGLQDAHFKHRSSKDGVELGLGMQTAINPSWDVRGEYDYIQYNGSLKSDRFGLGMLYHFG